MKKKIKEYLPIPIKIANGKTLWAHGPVSSTKILNGEITHSEYWPEEYTTNKPKE